MQFPSGPNLVLLQGPGVLEVARSTLGILKGHFMAVQGGWGSGLETNLDLGLPMQDLGLRVGPKNCVRSSICWCSQHDGLKRLKIVKCGDTVKLLNGTLFGYASGKAPSRSSANTRAVAIKQTTTAFLKNAPVAVHTCHKHIPFHDLRTCCPQDGTR